MLIIVFDRRSRRLCQRCVCTFCCRAAGSEASGVPQPPMCLPTALARPTPVPSEPRPPADCAPAPLPQPPNRRCMQPLNENLPPLKPVESISRNPAHMLRAIRYLCNTNDQRLGTLGAASFRRRTARQPGPVVAKTSLMKPPSRIGFNPIPEAFASSKTTNATPCTAIAFIYRGFVSLPAANRACLPPCTTGNYVHGSIERGR